MSSATNSIAIGYNSMGSQINNANDGNIAIGAGTLSQITGTSADKNIAIGSLALSGVSSGSDNIGIGDGAGDTITTGSQNLIIGALDVDTNSQSSAIRIGDGDGGTTWMSGDANGLAVLKHKTKPVTGNTTLTAAQSGRVIYVTSGVPTLPGAAEMGQHFIIVNNTGSTLTPGLGDFNAIATNWTAHQEMPAASVRHYRCVASTKWIYSDQRT